LSGDATFLQRLLVGWTRSRGVKLVPFSEKERTNVCGQTIARAWTPVARPATEVIFEVGARSRLFLSHHLDAIAAQPPIPGAQVSARLWD
jgi:hypothetical protein